MLSQISKGHNSVSVHPKSIILGQMTNLNMVFHVVVSYYRLVKIWNSPQFPAEFQNGQLVFTLVTLNNSFMIRKLNTLRPSLKITIPQPLLIMSKPLDITSSGITLIFFSYLWQAVLCTTIIVGWVFFCQSWKAQ